jgi:hypothetical protein
MSAVASSHDRLSVPGHRLWREVAGHRHSVPQAHSRSPMPLRRAVRPPRSSSMSRATSCRSVWVVAISGPAGQPSGNVHLHAENGWRGGAAGRWLVAQRQDSSDVAAGHPAQILVGAGAPTAEACRRRPARRPARRTQCQAQTGPQDAMPRPAERQLAHPWGLRRCLCDRPGPPTTRTTALSGRRDGA